MNKSLDYYLNQNYRLEIVESPEGGYAARYPDLPGCITCGDTIERVLENAKDAKLCWLEAAVEDEIEIFDPSDFEKCSGNLKLHISMVTNGLNMTLAAMIHLMIMMKNQLSE